MKVPLVKLSQIFGPLKNMGFVGGVYLPGKACNDIFKSLLKNSSLDFNQISLECFFDELLTDSFKIFEFLKTGVFWADNIF